MRLEPQSKSPPVLAPCPRLVMVGLVPTIQPRDVRLVEDWIPQARG